MKPNMNHKLLDDLHDGMWKLIYDNISSGVDGACNCIYTENYCIEVDVNSNDDVKVLIYGDKDANSFPNIVNAIWYAIPDWSDVYEKWEEDNPEYDEWNEHGFANERDYYTWRYG